MNFSLDEEVGVPVSQWNDEMLKSLDPYSSQYHVNFSDGTTKINQRSEVLRSIRLIPDNQKKFENDRHDEGYICVNGNWYRWEIWYYRSPVNNEPLEPIDYVPDSSSPNIYRVLEISTYIEYHGAL